MDNCSNYEIKHYQIDYLPKGVDDIVDLYYLLTNQSNEDDELGVNQQIQLTDHLHHHHLLIKSVL